MFDIANNKADGILDAEEMEHYIVLNNLENRRLGLWVDDRPHRAATQFALANQINPKREGVSREELSMLWAPYFKKFEALREADGLK